MTTPSAPSSDSFRTATVVVGIASNFSTIAQVYQFLRIKGGGEAISVLAWGMYTLSSVMWLVYGMMIDDFGLFLSSIVGTAANGSVLLIGLRAWYIDGRYLDRATAFYERVGST